MTIAAHQPEDMVTPRGQGWGNYSRGRTHDADNPPEAPKVSNRGSGSGGMLRKGRVGTEIPDFICQMCEEKPATKQMPGCGHIICEDCLLDGGRECPIH